MSSINGDLSKSGSDQHLRTVTLSKAAEVEKNETFKEEEHDVNFEKAITLTGTGIFHISIAFVSGFTFLAAGLQTSLNAYILPSAQCDLSLTSEEMGLLNAVFLAGTLTSSFLWGALADTIGRRKVLVSGMLIDGFLTLMSSFTQCYHVLLMFRFFNGFVVGGPSALILAYMGEFFPERLRAKVICYVGVMWTLSWAIMPAIAWVVIPIQWSVTKYGFTYNSWRLLIAIMALPSLLSSLMLYFFPESPRFLLSCGHDKEARDILAFIYSRNTGNSPDRYVVKSLCCEERKSSDSCNNCEESEPTNSTAWLGLSTLVHQGQGLFVMPTLKTTALTCTLFFTNMFGYYGLGLWLPELFNRFEQHYAMYPNTSVSVCELSGHFEKTVSGKVACDSSSVDSTVFTNSLIIGCFGLAGNLISGILSGRLHRRTLPAFLMFASGFCVLAIYYLQNSTQNLIVSALFQFFIGTAHLVINSLIVDMFPPSISGMGVCLTIFSGRLGAMVSNLVFGHLLDISCAVPILLVAAVSFAGGFISLLIPKHPYSEDKQKIVEVKGAA